MIVRCAFLVFVLVTSAAGQETRGAIQGRESDPSGASVAAAQVHATNSRTGVEVSAVTNESGNYALPYLLPGNYTVTAQAAGLRSRSATQSNCASTIVSTSILSCRWTGGRIGRCPRRDAPARVCGDL